jgi:hypothetical protein
MATSWVEWKRFPNPQLGENVEAPIGPGVYEVRSSLTGELVAFGHASNVAQALAELLPGPSLSFWPMRLLRSGAAYPVGELEYRTCAARSVEEAKTIASRLSGRREAYMKRRAAVSLA